MPLDTLKMIEERVWSSEFVESSEISECEHLVSPVSMGMSSKFSKSSESGAFSEFGKSSESSESYGSQLVSRASLLPHGGKGLVN